MNFESSIEKIKNGDFVEFDSLLKAFHPLIYGWIRRIGKLYSQDREDYYSSAKIILFECVMEFDKGRGVPFESFYKITLFHWYSNHASKMCKEELTDIKEQIDELQYLVEQEKNERMQLLNAAMQSLTPKQQRIIRYALCGYHDKEIAQLEEVSLKNVRNNRERSIKKLRHIILNET